MLLGNEPLHIDCHVTLLVIYLENRHVGHMPDVGSLWYLGRVQSRPSCKLLCTSRRIVTVHAAKASVWNSVEPSKEPNIFRPLPSETSVVVKHTNWNQVGTKWNQDRNQADSLQKMGYA